MCPVLFMCLHVEGPMKGGFSGKVTSVLGLRGEGGGKQREKARRGHGVGYIWRGKGAKSRVAWRSSPAWPELPRPLAGAAVVSGWVGAAQLSL